MSEDKMVIFWDWLGTLVTSDLFLGYHSKVRSGNLALLEQAHRYARIENSVSYIPFAWTLVEQFNKRGMKQVIVSNGSLSEIKAQLACAPFQKFDLVLTASEFNPKPDTHMFEYAFDKFKCKNTNAIFVADSPVDEVAARAAGVDFYKVDTHLTSYLAVAQKFGFVEV